jgi:hypothetical protein
VPSGAAGAHAHDWHVASIAQISVDNFVIKRPAPRCLYFQMGLVTNVKALFQEKFLYESKGCEVFVRYFLRIAAKVPRRTCIGRPVENVALHAAREAA